MKSTLLLLMASQVVSATDLDLIADTPERSPNDDSIIHVIPNVVNNIKGINNDEFFMVDAHRLISNGVDQPHRSMTHNIKNHDEPTIIARNPVENPRPRGLSWNQEMTELYGVKQDSENTPTLLTIDPLTGVATVIAGLSGLGVNQTVQGITIDENNGCYIVATDSFNHDTNSFLYECNLSTGELNFVGSQNIAPDIHDLAASCDGKLYGTDSTLMSLYDIDKNNGNATLIGSLGYDDAKGALSMTYDRQTDTIYQYVLYDSGYHTAFAKLDKETGEATPLSEFYIYGTNIGANKSSCTAEKAAFPLNIGFNGSWFNPEFPGQGFLLDVLTQSNTLFVAWFTYEVESEENRDSTIGSTEHRWLSAQGELGDDNSVELSIFNTFGGVFNDSTAVESEVVGSMTVNFENCSEGTISYTFDNGYFGVLRIQRIANDNVALCEELMNSEN